MKEPNQLLRAALFCAAVLAAWLVLTLWSSPAAAVGPAPFSYWASSTASSSSSSSSSSGGGSPTFGGEAQQWDDSSSGSSNTITLTSTIPAGARPVLLIDVGDTTAELTSVASTGGASWSILTGTAQRRSVGGQYGVMATTTANLAVALTTSDTITLTWSTVGSYCTRRCSIVYLLNVASAGQPDVAAAARRADFQDTAPTVSGTVTATNSVGIGMVFGVATNTTQSSPTWTLVGKSTNTTNGSLWKYRSEFTSAGAKTMATTLNDTDYWTACFAVFK